MLRHSFAPAGILIPLLISCFSGLYAQENRFEQLNEKLPTPTPYRTASGAPGPAYYQQQADYVMNILLDDKQQRISGTETITYINNSPDVLTYLWLQLDQNYLRPGSDTRLISTQDFSDGRETLGTLSYLHDLSTFPGGHTVEEVKDSKGTPLHHVIRNTMMRIDLPAPLPSKGTFTFSVKWWYQVQDRLKFGGRSGFEYFPEDSNYLYTIAQFFPRMCVYNETEGWQTNQFLGSSEFALTFGNYTVNITAPADHVVAATGVLQNPQTVLSEIQRKRLEEARQSEVPVFIVTPEEAKSAENQRVSGLKTWTFKADNVRDFAFASSRKFMWDAQGVKLGSRTVLAMSYFPKEGNPLWEKYSTRAVAHTVRTYSKYTFDYPYPVAISVHTHQIGMEYPMICFNGGRPEPDGTYSEQTKYGMISVIIHEVGHNYFPMIVNSDERQWTWMDEGLNTFLQYLSEQEWERTYPSRWGPAGNIIPYMKGDRSSLSPIMSNGDVALQVGPNAYGKPCTGLVLLRETIMGRELFDFAFKTYAQRWMFRHPTPADFFRTMEDASGVDLDWFWRNWFYGIDPVDISLERVHVLPVDTENPEIENTLARQEALSQPEPRTTALNREAISQTVLEREPDIVADFYNKRDKYAVSPEDRKDYESFLARLKPEEKALLEGKWIYYQVDLRNVGGCLMPLILEFSFTDGTRETVRIPAEIWQKNNKVVNKVFWFPATRVLDHVTLDPLQETPDIDTWNNRFPRVMEKTRLELYRESQIQRENEMQRAIRNGQR